MSDKVETSKFYFINCLPYYRIKPLFSPSWKRIEIAILLNFRISICPTIWIKIPAKKGISERLISETLSQMLLLQMRKQGFYWVLDNDHYHTK